MFTRYIYKGLLLLASISICSEVSSNEDVLSKEYRVLRGTLYTELNSHYRECTDAVAGGIYKQSFESCAEKPVAERHSDGCGHVAQLETEREIISGENQEYNRCLDIKISKEKFHELLEAEIRKRGIEKYEKKT